MCRIPPGRSPAFSVYRLSRAQRQDALADGTPIARCSTTATSPSVSPGRRGQRRRRVARRAGGPMTTSWQVAMVASRSSSWWTAGTTSRTAPKICRVAPVRRAVRRRHSAVRDHLQRQPAVARQVSGPVRAAHDLSEDAVPDPDPHRERRDAALAGAAKATRSRPAGTRTAGLFDDSAPRIPVGKDVLPGQAVTLSRRPGRPSTTSATIWSRAITRWSSTWCRARTAGSPMPATRPCKSR